MAEKDNLVITNRPKLCQPSMICGIDGWVNGGEAATGGIDYLRRHLGSRKFAEIPIARFHIFQIPGEASLRPHVKMDNGLVKEHRFPQNEFFYWIDPVGPSDLILFKGTEPNLYWEDYVNAIFRLADEFSVSRIYLLGGVLDETPHTREPNVSCACSNATLKEEMENYKVQYSNYEGPGSFSTTMLYMAKLQSRDVISMTARATYYPEYNIIIPHNPKSIRTLLRRLNTLLHVNLDFTPLNKEVTAFEGKLETVRTQSPRFNTYVEELEKNYVENDYEEPLDLSPDEAVKLAEEFLRH